MVANRELEALLSLSFRPMGRGIQEIRVARSVDERSTVLSVLRGRSIARFGDSELLHAYLNWSPHRFQEPHPALSRELLHTIDQADEVDAAGCIVAMPWVTTRPHWQWVWSKVSDFHREHLRATKCTFGDTHCTRPQSFFKFEDIGSLWSDCWPKRRVTIITGSRSRFEPTDALFGSAGQISMLDSAAPTNAYSSLHRLTREALGKRSNTDVYVISLGPTGTILARDLTLAGCVALNIGHLPNSLAHVNRAAPRHEDLPMTRGI